ncbi:MAG TPA: ThuA domain-containing protein [Opitutaceae bacterium]|nr:ThuA domain-containing protein [Opitutaceae bacterium]
MIKRSSFVLLSVTALAAATAFAPALTAAEAHKKVLYFNKSSGYEHSVIKRQNGQPAFSEKILAELGPKYGIDFTFSKDGSLFTPEYLAGFDAYVFYTTGDLTSVGADGNPAIPVAGKQALLDAVAHGKGFVGIHSASDTFHTGEPGGTNPKDISGRYKNDGDAADPYIKMLGGEFIKHGAQQVAKVKLIDPKFPGAAGLDGWAVQEEWYSLKNFAPNLHVILALDTTGMKGNEYKRGPFPSTWAHSYEKGRVFYTEMGHREDVWENPKFQQLLFGGLSWALGEVEADVTPNLQQATPQANDIPPRTPPAKK